MSLSTRLFDKTKASPILFELLVLCFEGSDRAISRIYNKIDQIIALNFLLEFSLQVGPCFCEKIQIFIEQINGLTWFRKKYGGDIMTEKEKIEKSLGALFIAG